MDGAGRAKKRRDALAGLTLGAVLGDEKEQLTIPTRPQVNRTLLDIIREEEPNSRAYKNLVHHHHNKKSWKSFKDRLRLKKAGAVWTSSVPTSDVPLHRSSIASSTLSSGGGGFGQLSRRNSVRVDVEEDEEVDEAEMETGQGQVHLLNRSLSRVVSLQTDLTQEDTLHIEEVPVSDVPIMNCRSSMLRRNSSRIPSTGQPDEGVRSMRLSEALAAEREQIQRVVSSTEAAGRARAVEQDNKESGVEMGNNDEETVGVGGRGDVDRDEQQPEVRMSLMDLLGETDGQMGWSPYSGDEDEEDEEEDDEDAEEFSTSQTLNSKSQPQSITAMYGWDEMRSTLDAVPDSGRQAEMMRQVGNYYFQRDRFDAAIDAYSEAITMRPNVLVQLTNRAMCYCKKKDWEKLEEDCRSAIQLDNSSVKARYMLGLALLGKECYHDGVRELEEALSIGRRAEPKDFIVEEIWEELSKAKYLHWQQESATRSKELQNLEEVCLAALKQKQALEYFDTQGFIDLTSNANVEELEALTRVFNKVTDADIPREIPDYLCCKITHEIYRDPIITPSGVTYERIALLKHFAKVGHFDPVTRMRIQADQLAPNLAIKGAVQAFLNQHGWAYSVEAD